MWRRLVSGVGWMEAVVVVGGDRAAAVVVMRLRGGGEQQRDRAEQATADRGVVGSRERGEEAGREGYGSWVVCVVCNRGGSA